MRPTLKLASRTPGSVVAAGKLWLAIVLLFAGSPGCVQAAATILRVRHHSTDQQTRVVLDLSEAAVYEIRRVRDPERIAINVQGARFLATGPIGIGDGLLKRIRRNPGSSRAQVVLDLEQATDYHDFRLAAQQDRPERIVVDLIRHKADSAAAQSAAAVSHSAPVAPFVVVLDPGHGGSDPGAIYGGIKEKDIVLEVAREAARLLNGMPGYQAVLTRTSDCSLSLNQRVRIARQERGDVFLSIHANANYRRTMRGLEVYYLSLQRATDRQARILAARENAADLVGLDKHQKRDSAVVAILADLRLTQNQRQSRHLAESILQAAQQSDQIKARRVKQAGFQVLRTLAMPAALVELAYLSNREDRRLLASPEGRRALAGVIVAGILASRQDQRAVAVRSLEAAWTNRYLVRGGDTLWKLARRYRTTIAEICAHNELPSSRILAI
jgi:N-acetylmuramoyl-L-alanine amidase